MDLTQDFTQRFLDELREAFKADFYFACKAIFEQEFHSSWLSPQIHQPICAAISDHESNPRVAVVLPRAWLKSTICSVYYPIWRAMCEEDFTSLIVMNTFTNAVKKNHGMRGILANNTLLRALFPDSVNPTKCTDEAIRLPQLRSSADDTFEFAGVNTQTVGRHVRLIIEDDTIAPEHDSMTGLMMQPTKDQVEKAIGFHRVAHFLLTDFKRDQRIVVGTRWLERDLLAIIKQSEPEYRFLERSCLELPDGTSSPAGDPTYPERFDREVLGSIERTVGPYMFSTLMLNLPLAAADMVFQPEDIQLYEETPLGLSVYTTVDPAPPDSAGSDPDYNVVLTTGMNPATGRKYVLDYWRARANPGDVIEQIISHIRMYKPLMVGIESIAYQASLKYWLEEAMRKQDVYANVEKITNTRIKKEHRIRGLQPIFRNKAIYIRAWMSELKSELLAFPRGAHDDLIDALSMHLELWRQSQLSHETAQKRFVGNDPFSADNLIRELHERAMKKKGFPYDVLPYVNDSYRDDYVEYARY